MRAPRSAKGNLLTAAGACDNSYARERFLNITSSSFTRLSIFICPLVRRVPAHITSGIGWTCCFCQGADSAPEFDQQPAGEDHAGAGTVDVDGASAARKRNVKSSEHTRTLHNLPTYMFHVRAHAQSIACSSARLVQPRQGRRLGVGDCNFRKMAAICTSAASTDGRGSSMQRNTLPRQWALSFPRIVHQPEYDAVRGMGLACFHHSSIT
jgi:hypothetical protein